MMDKVKVLATLKDDMLSADSLRLETVAKVETWKKEYNGEPYGNVSLRLFLVTLSDKTSGNMPP